MIEFAASQAVFRPARPESVVAESAPGARSRALRATSAPEPPDVPPRPSRVAIGEGSLPAERAQVWAHVRSLVDETHDTSGLRALLAQRDLAEISRFSADRLARASALPEPCARRLAAAFALGRAVEVSRHGPRPALGCASSVHALVAPRLRGLAQEHFLVLLLDGRHRLQRVEPVSAGTLSASLVHPREVFAPAVRESAAAVIVVHNHPSGDPTPSLEDREVTRRLVESGRLLGIPLLDHLVVADDGWVSLREDAADLGFGRSDPSFGRAPAEACRSAPFEARRAARSGPRDVT